MKLSFLRLKNYRNISDCTIDLSRPITTIIGRNNSGKSSILEAIFACLSDIKIQRVINRNIRTGEAIIEVGFYLSPVEWYKLFRETGYPQFFVEIDQCKKLQKFEIKKRLTWNTTKGNLQTRKELIFTSLSNDKDLLKYSEHFSEIQKISNPNWVKIFGVAKMSSSNELRKMLRALERKYTRLTLHQRG
jgi:AAA15 family ATPase/GTPase